MNASIDISYYPLQEDYSTLIVGFVQSVKDNYPKLRVESNGLSTQVFGDYDQIMVLMQVEVKQYLQKAKSVFIIKLAAGSRTPESIPEALKKINHG